jgi:hypothetical protein
MKTTFTVSEVKGSKRSTNRIYTHAVIGKRNWKIALECAKRLNEMYPVNKFDYELKMSLIPVSELPFQVLHWSQSYNNAVKGLSNGIFQRSYLELRVVSVIPLQ